MRRGRGTTILRLRGGAYVVVLLLVSSGLGGDGLGHLGGVLQQ
jgi:hypothetical protein